MAIVKMKKFTLVALSRDKNDIYDALARGKNVELRQVADSDKPIGKAVSESIESLSEKIATVEETVHFLGEAVSEYNAQLSKQNGGKKVQLPKNGMARPLTEVSFDNFLNMESEQTQLFAYIDEISALRAERLDAEAKKAKAEADAEKLALYASLPHPTNWYKDTHDVLVGLAVVPTSSLEKVKAIAAEYQLVDITVEGEHAGNTLVAYAVHKADKAFLDAATQAGMVKSSMVCDVVPSVRLEELRRKKDEAASRIPQIITKIVEYRQYVGQFRTLIDYLDFKRKKVFADANLTDATDSAFVLEGFCPADKQQAVEKAVNSVSECNVLEFSDVAEDEFAPTLCKNNSFVKQFEVVTNTFTPPSYHGIDPNPMMSIFYFIIFGLMVADMGYGLILVILGIFAKFFIKQQTGTKNLLIMFGICGIAAVVVGALYGSLFSYQLFPGILPSPKDNPMVMIIISLYVGIIHIMAGIGCSMYAMFKRHDVAGALCDALSWEFFFGGLMLAVLNPALDMMNYWTFRAPQIVTYVGLGMIGLGLVVVLFTAGRKKKGFFQKIVGGLGGLYGIINYFGDVMSYIRIFGLMLSSALMGMVMNDLGAMVYGDGGVMGIVLSAILLVFAHVFNLVLGLLGVYIHDGRLQYVEFFGKFYEGDGQLFVPFGGDTKYTLIKD